MKARKKNRCLIEIWDWLNLSSVGGSARAEISSRKKNDTGNDVRGYRLQLGMVFNQGDGNRVHRWTLFVLACQWREGKGVGVGRNEGGGRLKRPWWKILVSVRPFFTNHCTLRNPHRRRRRRVRRRSAVPGEKEEEGERREGENGETNRRTRVGTTGWIRSITNHSTTTTATTAESGGDSSSRPQVPFAFYRPVSRPFN